MTPTEWVRVLDEVAAWWPLSEPWRRRPEHVYERFVGFTLGAVLEAVVQYRTSDKDTCPTPGRLYQMAAATSQRRMRDGIDPVDKPSCSHGHVWAVDHRHDDVCVRCGTIRHSTPCIHHRNDLGGCVYCHDGSPVTASRP
jgi:hypothetical protein